MKICKSVDYKTYQCRIEIRRAVGSLRGPLRENFSVLCNRMEEFFWIIKTKDFKTIDEQKDNSTKC